MTIDLLGMLGVFLPLGLAAYGAYRLAGPWAAGIVVGLAVWKMAWDSRRKD